ncbi:TolC family protein [Escherichia coli]|uniref:TolC family protein n=1 Tax=Escherichia coli TaxID=562 RepID=UPI002090FBB3|nr:TolC family protein [Escherichia coli]MCO4902613.1 TolC family protein [Escherichia coli]
MNRVCFIFVLLLIQGCSFYHKKPQATNAGNILSELNKRGAVYESIEKLKSFIESKYKDERLSLLIDNVLSNNNDLASSLLKLKQSEESLKSKYFRFYPDLDANVQANERGEVKNSKTWTQEYNSSLTLNYELDFWEKYYGGVKYDELNKKATEFDFVTLAYNLINTTGQLYWELALTNEKLKNLKTSKSIYKKIKDATELNISVGKQSQYDLLLIEQDLINLQSQVLLLNKRKHEIINDIYLLANRNINDYYNADLGFNKIRIIKFDDNNDTLTNLLSRPDVMSASAKLRSQSVSVHTSYLRLLPKITFSGLISSSNTAFTDLIQNPLATLGLGIRFPFLAWQSRTNEIETAKINYQQAEITFTETINKAIIEVNNLSKYHELSYQEYEYAKMKEMLSKERLRTDEIRYRVGKTDLKTVLQSRQTLLNSEIERFEKLYNYFYFSLRLALARGI